MNEMQLKAVGTVRNDTLQPVLVADSGDLQWRAVPGDAGGSSGAISELDIYSEFEGILDGIEDFSHALVLYWAHFVGLEGRRLIKVHPMGRKDLPLIGLFASCSPARPNPICVSAVRILERNHRRADIAPDALRAFESVQAAQSRLTDQARSNWRWRILYLRALIDKELYERKGAMEGPQLRQAFDELTHLYHAENAHSKPIKPPEIC